MYKCLIYISCEFKVWLVRIIHQSLATFFHYLAFSKDLRLTRSYKCRTIFYFKNDIVVTINLQILVNKNRHSIP